MSSAQFSQARANGFGDALIHTRLAKYATFMPRAIAVCAQLLIGAYALVLPQPANAATITVNAADKYSRVFVDVTGEIVSTDERAFEQKVANLSNVPHKNVIVTLSGPGGDAVAAMKIGDLIHKNGWMTYVPSGTVCASSCAIIWLAGDPRTIEGAPGVLIGLHAIYNADTQRETGAGNAVLGYYLAHWGLNDLGVMCATVTPPDDMGWLTGQDGKGCGITWEILKPDRDAPLSLWKPPSPTPAPSQTQAKESGRRELVLACDPPLAANTRDPIVKVVVGLTVINDPSPKIADFDAWYLTARGVTYKRSEQYSDRRVEIPNVQQARWIWEGRWVRDQNIYMIGQLELNKGGSYSYSEWRYFGNPGPQNVGEEITNTMCSEVKQKRPT